MLCSYQESSIHQDGSSHRLSERELDEKQIAQLKPHQNQDSFQERQVLPLLAGISDWEQRLPRAELNIRIKL